MKCITNDTADKYIFYPSNLRKHHTMIHEGRAGEDAASVLARPHEAPMENRKALEDVEGDIEKVIGMERREKEAAATGLFRSRE